MVVPMLCSGEFPHRRSEGLFPHCRSFGCGRVSCRRWSEVGVERVLAGSWPGSWAGSSTYMLLGNRNQGALRWLTLRSAGLLVSCLVSWIGRRSDSFAGHVHVDPMVLELHSLVSELPWVDPSTTARALKDFSGPALIGTVRWLVVG